MRAMVLWTINDFPARSSLSGWSGQGYKACPTCNKDTSSVRVLGKTDYVSHRRFLKKPHKWRMSLEFNGEIEDGDPPRKFDRDQIQAQFAILPTCVKGKHPSYGGVKIKRNVHVELNWTKRCIFYELEYWSFLTLKHNLDIMHIKKNMLETILNTLLMNDKSKDIAKARQDLKRLGIRSGLWLCQTKNRKYSKPQAAYSFTPENRKKFCQFIKGVKLQVRIPTSKLKVTDNDTNITGLKSHDSKPEGSIAEGYVAEEALTFSSHYFWDVTTKFNRLDRNVDPPPPTCQFQVFRSLYKSIGLRSVIWFDAKELKKVICKFPNKDMKEEFPDWFGSQIRQRHVDNDQGVSATNELFALACGPTPTPILVNSCVVNGVRFVMHNRDERRTTQNNDICSPGGKDGEMYYGQLQKILEFFYLSFKVVLFRVKWFDTSNEGRKVKHLVLRNNMTQILTKGEAFTFLQHKSNNASTFKIWPNDNPTGSLNDLENATLHIDGQSTEVDALPYIIDLDEDDDIIDDEDALPHDLADSDDEDLVNVDDDDGVDVMSADVARGHGGDGGGDDRPPTHHIPTGCGGCFANRGKGTRKPNLGGRKAGRLHTRQETRNLGLKKITDDKGPVPIRFEWDDKKTLMPLGDHASHWSNYLGELIREMPLYYPSWQKVPAERKAAILTKIGMQFDLKPHMQSQCWTDINACIQQHLQKLYNTNKASLKAAHWVINPEIGMYDMESIRQRRPENITPADWDAQLAIWNDPRNQARAASKCQYQGNSALGRGMPVGIPVTCSPLRSDGRQQGHLLGGVGRVLPGRATDVLISPPPPPPQCTHNSGDVKKLKKKNKYLTKQVNLMMKLFRSDDKFSQMLTQYESTPEFGSGSGGCGDDEMADDEDGGEDEEDEEDGDS
ncbi:hypothetical protein Tco_0526788 [Tanacetum coccineum]